jgi:CheY-like chemotaxis protein
MSYKILIVDDDSTNSESLATFLSSSHQLTCECKTASFEEVDSMLNQEFDIIITDYKNNVSAGINGKDVIEKIQEKYFCPVIIYTWVINSVNPSILSTWFLSKIEKGSDTTILVNKIIEILQSKEFQVKHEIETELNASVKENFRGYFWNIVHNHWGNFRDIDKNTLKGIMMRKVLKDLHQTYQEQDELHPIEIYEHPIESDKITTGTIVKHLDEYYICINNDCDLLRPKPELKILFLKIDHPLFLNKISGCSTDDKKKSLINNTLSWEKERCFVFPKTFFFRGWVASFDTIVTLPTIQVWTNPWGQKSIQIGPDVEIFAKLNLPFLSMLVSNFTRFYSRVWVPTIKI